jgi:hypothetical protein
MSIWKFLKENTIENTLESLLRRLNWIFSNLDSKNVKRLNFSETDIITSRNKVEIFDDFLYQAISENDTPWILNSGADAQAVDPAIDNQESGVLKFVSGNADGTVVNDGCQLVCSLPVQAQKGNLIFETRLHINTAITNLSICAGFTDSTVLEEPFTNAADVITSNASDAACFVYDDGATTKEWFMCAVDSNTDDTGNTALGTAPIADTWQTLRIEVSEDGTEIKFFIDGEKVGTLNKDAGVSPDVNLFATIVICSTTTSSKDIDVDYVFVSYNRE